MDALRFMLFEENFLKKPLTRLDYCDRIYLPLKRGFICVEKKTHINVVKYSVGSPAFRWYLYRKGEKDESKNHIGLYRMQAEKLRHYEKQEE